MNQNSEHTSENTKEKKSGLFGYLLILTAFFILIEISYFIQRSDIYLGDYQLVADHLKIPGKVIPGVLYFLFVQLLLHFLFTVAVWGVTRLMSAALNCTWKTTEKVGFTLWFVGILNILLANEFFFPNSKFAGLMSLVVSRQLVEFLLIAVSALSFSACLMAFWGFIKSASIKLKLLVASLCLIAGLGLTFKPALPVTVDAGTIQQPNVILIGIDSLRPDFLGYFGYEKITPHLDNFLNNSAVFADAFTAIARTFPSWVSILTGEYPKKNGVRFNLPDMSRFNWQSPLPAILRQHGYETMFATDEVRFSNIDERFGFDKVVTPPAGFNDFLLGTLNDFPMANLLVNTWVGKYLLPHSFGNRPAFNTYDPDSFLRLLQPSLAQSRTKPLFLAVHFCLPHYPYLWGGHLLNDRSIRNYQASIKRVDQQFNDFLNMLKQDHLLDHSIVVVLSDHGEAIELHGDRATKADLFVPGAANKKHVIPHFYPKSYDTETVDQSAGHGTDILGLTQSHTVLAFQLFGLMPNQTIALPGRVSLLDIKPTILQLLHLPAEKTNDGNNLLGLILGQKSLAIPQKDFFMETDFSPQAVRSVHPESRNLLFEGIDFFQIDPVTTRLIVKKSMADLIISSKQYADIYGDWMLALYPQNKGSMVPILLNLQSGQWTDDLDTSFARKSPVKHMLVALKDFYGKDISRAPS